MKYNKNFELLKNIDGVIEFVFNEKKYLSFENVNSEIIANNPKLKIDIILYFIVSYFIEPIEGHINIKSEINWILMIIYEHLINIEVGNYGRTLPVIYIFHEILNSSSEEIYDVFAKPPIYSAYLLAEIEFIMKIKSKYLDREGKVISKIPNQLSSKLKRKKGRRYSRIGDIYEIFMYRNESQELRDFFKSADKIFSEYAKISQADFSHFSIYSGYNIKSRIRFLRNEISMHGSYSDYNYDIYFIILLYGALIISQF
jgi:hypothetical protein